jgi:hypothetical protein
LFWENRGGTIAGDLRFGIMKSFREFPISCGRQTSPIDGVVSELITGGVVPQKLKNRIVSDIGDYRNNKRIRIS